MKTPSRSPMTTRPSLPGPDVGSDPQRRGDIQLTWTADGRKELAIRQHVNLMGFETPANYLIQVIAGAIASNEADTSITSKGHLVSGSLCGCNGIGISQDM
jgi:hypothetical protein